MKYKANNTHNSIQCTALFRYSEFAIVGRYEQHAMIFHKFRNSISNAHRAKTLRNTLTRHSHKIGWAHYYRLCVLVTFARFAYGTAVRVHLLCMSVTAYSISRHMQQAFRNYLTIIFILRNNSIECVCVCVRYIEIEMWWQIYYIIFAFTLYAVFLVVQ